jgi:molybdopterin biosynthesis enzyme MoaB
VLAPTNASVQEIHTFIVIGPTGFAPDDVALRKVTTI